MKRHIRLFPAMFLALLLSVGPVSAGGGPIIDRVFPAGANVAGGNSVMIYGNTLEPLVSVSIGGQPAAVIRSTSGEVFVNSPALPEGVYDVVVQTGTGTATLPNAFAYTTDFDISRDFSADTNPVGAWRYGEVAAPGQAFELDTERSIVGCADTWATSPSLPSLAHNRTDASCAMFTWNWPAGLIGLHPGGGPRLAVIRFTAPSTAVYEVSGHFTCIDSAVAGSVNAYIHRNLNETLVAEFINVSHQPRVFNFAVALAAGETLDFSQDNGGNGNGFDQMVIDARIEPIVFADGFEPSGKR